MAVNFQKINMEQKARECRNNWALTPSEPIRLKSLLLQLGVNSVFRPLNSDQVSGMCIKIMDNLCPMRFMLINSSQTLGRQHFTICHELYHLFVQSDFSSMVCKAGTFNRKDIHEYQADLFASYFLLPEEGILKVIPSHEKIGKNKITLPTILRIEQYFSCSRMALLIRLKDIGLIDEVHLEKFKNNVIKSAREWGHTTSLYRPGNENLFLGNYGELAKSLFDNEQISEGHYSSLMYDIGIDIFETEEGLNHESENHFT